MFCQEGGMLRRPFLLFPFKVFLELLVALVLHNHLLVEGLLLFLQVSGMLLFLVLDLLFILHLRLRLLFSKHFELSALCFDFLTVLLLHFRHLLFVKSIACPQLVLHAALELFNLALQVQQNRLLFFKKLACHENLVGIAQAKAGILLLLATKLLEIEDAQAAVIASAEEVQFIPGDANPRYRSGMGLVLNVVSCKWELVAAQGARHVRLCHAGD
mmetsp:Transcript_95456/g.227381  ORF Transcript_95456/g.227381 Transcript_95456/m.227381 type:complete len:215 (+) Transcript_95456:1178-1822(+)